MAYATIQEGRDFGITVEMASDEALAAALELWSRVIDRACRQWFEPRSLDFKIDGTGTSELHLDVPVISVSALYVNGDTTALPADQFVVYNTATGYPDDRGNPRIALSYSNSSSLFFQASWRAPIFVKGNRNQRVVGSFGFVESDGTTPLPIKRAVLKLTKLKLQEAAAAEAGEIQAGEQGPLVRERTDDHEMEWSGPQIKQGVRGSTISGITNDPEINAIVRLYRAPMSMAVVGGGRF